ncbi:hypothetical protein [Sediminimonas qiaohouensis]|uniref:hypothetical protein n=1 Tax=Sediminimonas qiaohouensis TaxID=552061 RepID=UPI00041662AF|nr:hypothetical protein [Sediminimonas qiaohouensis]
MIRKWIVMGAACAALANASMAEETDGMATMHNIPEGLLCPGNWTFEAGQTSTPSGPGDPGGVGQVAIEVKDCGKTLVLKEFLTGIPDGQVDRVFNQVADGVYRHATAAQGMPVEVTLKANGLHDITGKLLIQGGMISRPLTATHVRGGKLQVQGCEEKQKDDRETEIGHDEATKAMIDAMRRLDLKAPAGSGLELADYVSSYAADTSRSSGKELHARRIALRLADDGRVLPNPEAITPGRLECAVEDGALEPATRFLIIKLYIDPFGTYTAAAQLLAINSVIEAQQFPDEASRHPSYPIEWAIESLEMPLGPATDGRIAN